MILLLTLAAVFALLTISTSAAEETVLDSGEAEGFTWTLMSDGTLTISGTGTISSSLKNSWKSWNNMVKSVEIESNVYGIGDQAFYKCSNLTSVTIQYGVTEIGYYAFNGCSSLSSITIPDSMAIIGYGAFYNCSSLNSVIIPENIISLGDYAFYNCSALKSVTIPDGLTKIGGRTFYNCSRLTSISIPESVTSIGSSAFYNCSCLTSISIPDGVTSIGASAFNNCSSLTNVIIPVSVTEIGTGAFRNCESMTEINVVTGNEKYISDKGVLYNQSGTNLICCPAGKEGTYSILNSGILISDYAFEKCSKLTTIDIPKSVISIGKYAFYGCKSLAGSLEIPEGITKIETYTFDGCSSLTSVSIPIGVNIIDSYAFFYCTDLTSVTIPEGVTKIGNYAFYNCGSLTNLTLPESISNIGNNAFGRCGSLISINIPSDITNIESYTFAYCSNLISINIPKSVSSIGTFAFDTCKSLTNVTIPESVKKIGTGAFQGCRSLTDIYYGGSENQWAGISISDYNVPLNNATIHYASVPVEIVSPPADVTIAAGKTAVFTVEATGSDLAYQWQYKDPTSDWKNSTSTGYDTNTIKVQGVSGETNRNGFQYRCVITDANGNQMISDPATLTVTEQLKITTQPADYTGAVNSTAKFTVEATGDGLSYQWQYSDNGGKTWLASSLKTATYSAKLTAEKDGRMVRCIVTDQYGNSVTSDAAKMTVATLSILAQPANYTGALNSTAKFAVMAEGDGLKYQWQYSDDEGKTWGKSTITSATYSAQLTAAKNGRMVRCIVTDQYGNTAISSAAKMTIVSSLKITTQPKDYTGAVNSTAKFTVAASGTGLTYQWQYSDDNGKTWLASSIKTATYSAKFTADKNNRMVRCIVTDASGNTVTSNAAKMTLTGPVITSQPQNYVGAVNSTAKFTVAATGDGLTYQWQYSDDNGATWLASSIKSATYSAKFTADKNNRMVRCIVTDANGNTVTSNAASMKLG